MLYAALLISTLAQTPPAKPAPPPEARDFKEFFTLGSMSSDWRLRYESVDNAAFAKTATAMTLRSRTGLRSAALNNFSVYLEGESVYALQENYNSTANGRTQYPIVADPKGSEINQAYVAYGFNTADQFILGRQRINYDNQRFFGGAAFRQNEQTYDALSANVLGLGGNTNVRMAYINKVHRVFGNSNPNPLLRQYDLRAGLFNLGYQFPADPSSLLAGTTLTGYAYYVENKDVPLSSARTLGLRYLGGVGFSDNERVNYTLEYANQNHFRDGSSIISADYWLADATLALDAGKYTVKLAQETLGGNGRYAFQTPFATLHAFNGWADRFLTTPVKGLQDRFVDAGAKFGRAAISGNFHRYNSDQGNTHYGDEFGLQYLFTYNDKLSFNASYANYNAKTFASDTKIFWLSVDYKFTR
jgi:hypothetical protein